MLEYKDLSRKKWKTGIFDFNIQIYWVQTMFGCLAGLFDFTGAFI